MTRSVIHPASKAVRGILALALSVAAATPGAAQEAVELEVVPVQGCVHMFQTPTAGGNMAVLPGPDGVPSWGPRDLVPIIYFEMGGVPPTVR